MSFPKLIFNLNCQYCFVLHFLYFKLQTVNTYSICNTVCNRREEVEYETLLNDDHVFFCYDKNFIWKHWMNIIARLYIFLYTVIPVHCYNPTIIIYTKLVTCIACQCYRIKKYIVYIRDVAIGAGIWGHCRTLRNIKVLSSDIRTNRIYISTCK